MTSSQPGHSEAASGAALYTAEQRHRRDASPWTLVQGILAILQFFVFLVSLALIARYLLTGNGLVIATVSIVAKTVILYTIMTAGAIWEREVFGQYLFAPAFFWEDVVSILVLALHTAYLVALAVDTSVSVQIWIAIAAYGAYAINAAQFLWKLRRARLEPATAREAARPESALAASEGAS